jgi:mono/diheme cytochrome c family protein
MNSHVDSSRWPCALVVTVLALSACTLKPDRQTSVDKLTYHHDSQRTGWNNHETVLTPTALAGTAFGLLWETPTLDYFESVPPRLFASPLYVDSVRISIGRYQGGIFSTLYVVATTGYIYAISAFESGGTPPGSILWRKQLTGKPCYEGTQGNLSTPVIDLRKRRLYVTSCRNQTQWQAHAVDIRSGKEISGWPVNFDNQAMNAEGVNKNGVTKFGEKNGYVQRGALNLSPDGSRLYVTFGLEGGSGWIVAVDTNIPKVSTAFAATAITEEQEGGMWASSGPSLDEAGNIYIATGTRGSPAFYATGVADLAEILPNSVHSWGQSILKLKDDPNTGFALVGTYTPFNYCQAAATDIDLGSGGTTVFDLDPAATATPHLLVLSGDKQGNVYLLDRMHMPGGVTKRHPCSTDSTTDLSLLSPNVQPQFGQRGPINVFGPYSDQHGMFDQAKSHSGSAYFRSASGANYIFATGSSKRGEDSSISIPPGLARLKVIATPGQSAYLRIDQLEESQTFQNPGPPIVTSCGGKNAIVWVLDGAPRTATLYGTHAARPVLYAFDALGLKLLWKSTLDAVFPSGKYNEPTVVNGTVFIGTDRIQAFGLRPPHPKTGPEFTPLFDGKTLTHWRGDPAVWSVEDGAITGRTQEANPKTTFLIHDASYRNFELHFKYRFHTASGNSGVQYRSRFFPEHQFSIAGYQANLVTLDARERLVILSDENARGDLARLGERTDVFRRGGKVQRKVLSLVNQPEAIYAALKPYPEWNHYVVIAYGNRIIHAVNGFLAVDVLDDDFESRASEGVFAIQIYPGPPVGVQFKDIEVKELIAPPDFIGQFKTHAAPAPAHLLSADQAALEMGRGVYEKRCAMCHSDNQSSTPPKETLSELAQGKIVDTLTNGVMQEMAVGLGDDEIQAVAIYLTTQIAQ